MDFNLLAKKNKVGTLRIRLKIWIRAKIMGSTLGWRTQFQASEIKTKLIQVLWSKTIGEKDLKTSNYKSKKNKIIPEKEYLGRVT